MCFWGIDDYSIVACHLHTLPLLRSGLMLLANHLDTLVPDSSSDQGEVGLHLALVSTCYGQNSVMMVT